MRMKKVKPLRNNNELYFVVTVVSCHATARRKGMSINNLKNLDDSAIVKMWNDLSGRHQLLARKADGSQKAKLFQQSERDHRELIDHLHQMVIFFQQLQQMSPDEIAERSPSEHLFKRATQDTMLSKITSELSVSYNNLGNALLEQLEPKINQPVHAYLFSLKWNPRNQYAIDNLWYCFDIASKLMATRVVRLPRKSTKIEWAQYHNAGYDLLKSPNSNPMTTIEAYKKALSIHSHPGTYHGLGIAFSNADMQNDAISAWMQTFSLDPDYNFELRIYIELD